MACAASRPLADGCPRLLAHCAPRCFACCRRTWTRRWLRSATATPLCCATRVAWACWAGGQGGARTTTPAISSRSPQSLAATWRRPTPRASWRSWRWVLLCVCGEWCVWGVVVMGRVVVYMGVVCVAGGAWVGRWVGRAGGWCWWVVVPGSWWWVEVCSLPATEVHTLTTQGRGEPGATLGSLSRPQSGLPPLVWAPSKDRTNSLAATRPCLPAGLVARLVAGARRAAVAGAGRPGGAPPPLPRGDGAARV